VPFITTLLTNLSLNRIKIFFPMFLVIPVHIDQRWLISVLLDYSLVQRGRFFVGFLGYFYGLVQDLFRLFDF